MPELPEVEAVRRVLRPAMQGGRFERVVSRIGSNLRFPFPDRFAARLEGRTVLKLERRGKHLIASPLDSGDVLLMHLGMSGSFRIEGASGSKATAEFYYQRESPPDATITSSSRCRPGVIHHVQRSEAVRLDGSRGGRRYLPRHTTLEAGLGPEPLSDGFDAAALARACCRKEDDAEGGAVRSARRRRARQHLRPCEALHRARLSPRRRASTIATPAGRARPAAAAAERRYQGGAAGGGGAQAAGGDYRGHRFRVYDREGERCLTNGCRGSVERRTQTGRSTFYCPACQR